MKLFLSFLFCTIVLAGAFYTLSNFTTPTPTQVHAAEQSLQGIDPSQNRKLITETSTAFVESIGEAYTAPVATEQLHNDVEQITQPKIHPIEVKSAANPKIIVDHVTPPTTPSQTPPTAVNIAPPNIDCPNDQLLVSIDTILHKAECQMGNGRIYTISLK